MQTLNNNEALLYAIFSLGYNQGKTLPSEYLAKIIGVSPLYISHMTKKMEEKGLIVKNTFCKNDYYNGHIKRVTSYTAVPSKGYVYLYTSFICDTSIPAKVRGFFIRLMTVANQNTYRIDYNHKDICKFLHITNPTLTKWLKELEKYGLIRCEERGIQILKALAPRKRTITPEASKKIEILKTYDDNLKCKKVFQYYYDRKFEGLNISITDFLDYCINGCPQVSQEVKECKSEPTYYEF